MIPTLSHNGKLLMLDKPLVMAIINATTDSFYTQHLHNGTDDIKRRIDNCVLEGATIIDIGGMSTRPGAVAIPLEDEWLRIQEILSYTRNQYPDIWISIDTYRSEIARRSIESGADIINDISGSQYDKAILTVAAHYQVPYIGMHIKGTPADMAQHAVYDDVTLEVLDYFISLSKEAMDVGIRDFIIDPGFGFAKDTVQNYQLLRSLGSFHFLEKPILVGISRKKMIQAAIGRDSTQALHGSVAATMLALQGGARIIRTHDVAATVDAIHVYLQYRSS